MANRFSAFVAACAITAVCIILATALAYFAPSPTPQPIARLLDALIYISIAGAMAIFGLIGYRPDKPT